MWKLVVLTKHGSKLDCTHQQQLHNVKLLYIDTGSSYSYLNRLVELILPNIHSTLARLKNSLLERNLKLFRRSILGRYWSGPRKQTLAQRCRYKNILHQGYLQKYQTIWRTVNQHSDLQSLEALINYTCSTSSPMIIWKNTRLLQLYMSTMQEITPRWRCAIRGRIS